MKTNRFFVGESWCGITMLRVSECDHCREEAARPPGPRITVTAVDRESGVITFSTEEDPDAGS